MSDQWTGGPDPDRQPEPYQAPPIASGYHVPPVAGHPSGYHRPPARAPRRGWSGAAIVFAAIFGAIIGGALTAAAVVGTLGYQAPAQRPGTPLASTQAPGRPLANATSTIDISESVAQKVVPSVVVISSMETVMNPFTGQSGTQVAGTGSGVIISADGKILTNNHVIDGASKIVVTIGVEKRVARVLGTDAKTDLAVIDVAGSGYPAIQFGSSADLKVGQYVMAVGSPFGLEKTVTSGIVSALNRTDIKQSASSVTAYTNLIQTDAAINPGNSGGALVNEWGQLVGINTLIQSTSGSSAGIGFAIPSDFARNIADQLIATGKATHPYLGVSTESVDQNVAKQFRLQVSSGALVRYVQPNSPAGAAGIKTGDIIVRIGRDQVQGVEDVFSAVRSYNVGDVVDVEVVRGKAHLVLKVTLGSDSAVR